VQFFRNVPWLVLLFFVMFLLPFEFLVGNTTIPFPDWIKATFGLALPIMVNVSEIVRGTVQSIPTAQWEAARARVFPPSDIVAHYSPARSPRGPRVFKPALPNVDTRMTAPGADTLIVRMSTCMRRSAGGALRPPAKGAHPRVP